ncbi:MAG: PAS domain S-box protein [bacterium]
MRNEKKRQILGDWLWTWVLSAVTLIAGSVFIGWSIRDTDHRMRSEYLHQTSLVARAIKVDDVKTLTGTGKDLASPVYQELKEQLTVLRATVPKCRSLYLLGRRPDGVIFSFVDSESAGSKEESSTGLEHAKAQCFLSAFYSRSEWYFNSETELIMGPISNRWGVWTSSFVTLRDVKSGNPVAVLGMDVDARTWRHATIRGGVKPLVFTSLLLLVILCGHVLFVRKPRWMPESLRRRGVVIQVAAMGLVLTLAATWIARQYSRRSYDEAFTQAADVQFANLTEAFHSLGDVELEGLARFFMGSSAVTPAEFHLFSEYLVKNPAVQAWEWIPAVRPSEIEGLEAAMRAGGDTGFMVWQKDEKGNRVRASGREVYYPIVYVEPRAGNESAIGYDPGSVVALRHTLESAARSRLPRITPPIKLVQETESQKGLVVYRPVFSVGEPRLLRGYVAAVLRLGTFLENTIGVGQSRDHPSLSAVMTQCESGRAPQEMASTVPKDRRGGYSVMRYLTAFGRLYALQIFPEKAFNVRNARLSEWLMLFAGLVLTGVLTVLVWVVETRRQYLEANVKERTSLLRDSEENFRRLFQHNPLPMALSSLSDGKFLDVNEAFLATLGYTRNEVAGKSAAELGLFRESERQNQLVSQLKQQGSLDNVELKFGRKDGSTLTGLISGELVRHQNTECILTVLVDITERKKGEAERLRLATAIKQAAEAIVITDPKGVIQYINPAFEAITGYAGGEVVGKTPRLLKSGKHDEAFYRDLWDIITSGRTWNGRIVNKKKDGAFYTEEGSIAPVRDESGAIVNYVAVKRDITNELKLERQFVQAQKMDVVGRLAGGVAHDFNNMLGVILGYTEMALAQVDPALQLHADLREVRSSALRTADLTRQLLAFARRQTVLPRILDLNSAVDSALRMLRRMIGENITLEWRPKPEVWPVRIDPSQIDQILSNLCVNARDATTGNGRVTIQTDNVVLDQAYCANHDGAYPGDYVMMVFSDTGAGMTADVLSHIFEPFYSTKGVGEGTGLGLSTVYGIVKQNHGYISAESKPGFGATFKIYLPSQKGQASEAVPSEAAKVLKGRMETVLLVEDDPSVLAMTQQMLKTLGYQVLASSRSHDAIQKVRETKEAIHVMIVDVVMPDMNGPELARQIHLFRPDLKCLFMSSYPSNVVVNSGVEDGVNFIQKPFSITALASILRKILEHG